MIPRRPPIVFQMLVFSIVLAACDGGSRSRTPDEFAADSALAADLALANRDTLLVDSIGAYRPRMDADSQISDVEEVESLPMTANEPSTGSPSPAPPAAAPAPAPPPAPPPVARARTAPAAPAV